MKDFDGIEGKESILTQKVDEHIKEILKQLKLENMTDLEEAFITYLALKTIGEQAHKVLNKICHEIVGLH